MPNSWKNWFGFVTPRSSSPKSSHSTHGVNLRRCRSTHSPAQLHNTICDTSNEHALLTPNENGPRHRSSTTSSTSRIHATVHGRNTTLLGPTSADQPIFLMSSTNKIPENELQPPDPRHEYNAPPTSNVMSELAPIPSSSLMAPSSCSSSPSFGDDTNPFGHAMIANRQMHANAHENTFVMPIPSRRDGFHNPLSGEMNVCAHSIQLMPIKPTTSRACVSTEMKPALVTYYAPSKYHETSYDSTLSAYASLDSSATTHDESTDHMRLNLHRLSLGQNRARTLHEGLSAGYESSKTARATGVMMSGDTAETVEERTGSPDKLASINVIGMQRNASLPGSISSSTPSYSGTPLMTSGTVPGSPTADGVTNSPPRRAPATLSIGRASGTMLSHKDSFGGPRSAAPSNLSTSLSLAPSIRTPRGEEKKNVSEDPKMGRSGDNTSSGEMDEWEIAPQDRNGLSEASDVGSFFSSTSAPHSFYESAGNHLSHTPTGHTSVASTSSFTIGDLSGATLGKNITSTAPLKNTSAVPTPQGSSENARRTAQSSSQSVPTSASLSNSFDIPQTKSGPSKAGPKLSSKPADMNISVTSPSNSTLQAPVSPFAPAPTLSASASTFQDASATSPITYFQQTSKQANGNYDDSLLGVSAPEIGIPSVPPSVKESETGKDRGNGNKKETNRLTKSTTVSSEAAPVVTPPTNKAIRASVGRSGPQLPSAPNRAPAPPPAMYWSRAPVHGSLPRRGFRAHTASLADEVVWLFAGCDLKMCFRELWCFDTETMCWSKPKVTGDVPKPRRAHSATMVDKRLFVFGGGDGPDYCNDLYIFDSISLRWSRPEVYGASPIPRRAHTCNYDEKEGRLIIFGGGNGVGALNDVYTLDVSDMNRLEWKKMECKGKIPIGRGYHTSNLVDNKLIVFGGSDGHMSFSDISILRLDTQVWYQVKTDETHVRLGHTATQVGSYLFVIGGHDSQIYTTDILTLNLVNLQWEPRRVCGAKPKGRGYHQAWLRDSRLFVHGGFDGKTAYDDLFTVDLGACAYLPQITSFTVDLEDP